MFLDCVCVCVTGLDQDDDFSGEFLHEDIGCFDVHVLLISLVFLKSLCIVAYG